MDRIGVFGGTFDPPHRGHLRLADAAHDQLQLDLVLWVPAGQPPHKQPQAAAPSGAPSSRHETLTAAHHRVEMIRLAIADRPPFLLSRLDLDRPGPHYTADLCTLLHDHYGPQTTFWFIVGQDSLRELPTWRAPGRVLQLCRLAVFPRQGPPVDWEELQAVIPAVRQRVDWLTGQFVAVSSTEVRRRTRRGESIRHLVPPAVGDYIRHHRLYQAEDS